MSSKNEITVINPDLGYELVHKSRRADKGASKLLSKSEWLRQINKNLPCGTASGDRQNSGVRRNDDSGQKVRAPNDLIKGNHVVKSRTVTCG